MTLKKLMHALQPWLACTLLAFALPTQSETAKIAAGEWPPIMDSKVGNGGPFTQFLVEAFADQGIEVKVDFFLGNVA